MSTLIYGSSATVLHYDPFTCSPTVEDPRCEPQFSTQTSYGDGASALRVFTNRASQNLVDIFARIFLRAASNSSQIDSVAPVQKLLDLTGWSQRRLATAIGVTHPTVAALLKGDAGALARSPQVRTVLADLTTLVTRLAPLSARKGYDLWEVLNTPGGTADASAFDLVRGRELGRAYVTALDAMNPDQGLGMSAGPYPVKAGISSVDLTE